jgi:Fe-Mn family superoxide dismutase
MDSTNSRRNFIKKSAALALGTIAATTVVNKALAATEFVEKETIAIDGVKFTLPDLPYGYDALEPHIDAMTMEIHHLKHHQAYVTNLNKALETVDGNVLGNSQSMENIFNKVAKLPPAIRNNAGGHYNHSLFWTLIKPNGGGEPKGKLAEAITKSFGSFVEFKKQFGDAATKRFGSGWAWLIVSDGKLVITSTANQDNPLMNLDSVEIKGTPVLALDVWEHAYYLKNQNRRADYIASWWNVVNWETAENLYAAAK